MSLQLDWEPVFIYGVHQTAKSGMGHNARKSEPWVGIKQEQGFWHIIRAHWPPEAGIATYFTSLRELASGGNDNQLLVWNQHSQQPALRLTEHTAAVKAIAWSPHQSGLLASGGGIADRCICFWNTTNGHQLNIVDTGSQVCNLAWSKNVNEIVSTHGYFQNQIMVWKYPSMTKTIVTGAGDETLRFWNVFPSMKTPTPVRDTGLWSLGRTQIR